MFASFLLAFAAVGLVVAAPQYQMAMVPVPVPMSMPMQMGAFPVLGSAGEMASQGMLPPSYAYGYPPQYPAHYGYPANGMMLQQQLMAAQMSHMMATHASLMSQGMGPFGSGWVLPPNSSGQMVVVGQSPNNGLQTHLIKFGPNSTPATSSVAPISVTPNPSTPTVTTPKVVPVKSKPQK